MTANGTTDGMTLDDYQRESAATDLIAAGEDPLIPLLGLGGEVGALLAEFKKQRRPDGAGYRGFDEVVVTELGDVLWYLAAVARRVDVSLSRVAAVNLMKTRSRWLADDPTTHTSFDDTFPESQRFPRTFTVDFASTTDSDGMTRVRMMMCGEPLGDPIDDNARDADGYRFHDVFHLSHAAVLGWSPVLRALMKRKRKADPEVDRAEDGARASACEEAVAALVFEMSKPYSYFEGAKHVDFAILNAVKAVTAGLEVATRSPAQWERAILAGFAVWRDLRVRGDGAVRVDVEARTLNLMPSTE